MIANKISNAERKPNLFFDFITLDQCYDKKISLKNEKALSDKLLTACPTKPLHR
jgi:hypothetical protein